MTRTSGYSHKLCGEQHGVNAEGNEDRPTPGKAIPRALSSAFGASVKVLGSGEDLQTCLRKSPSFDKLGLFGKKNVSPGCRTPLQFGRTTMYVRRS
jgi:hypothetical protein